MATRKKSISKRSRNRGISPRALMPAPIPRIRPAAFSRQADLVPRPIAKPSSGAELREPAPVPGRSVEIPDAVVPCRPQARERIGLGHLREELADGGPAEPQLREPHVGTPERSRL